MHGTQERVNTAENPTNKVHILESPIEQMDANTEASLFSLFEVCDAQLEVVLGTALPWRTGERALRLKQDENPTLAAVLRARRHQPLDWLT